MAKQKFLLDENIGKRVADALRKKGFSVASILEDAPGSTDREALERAVSEKRILVTLDRDFGALVYRDSGRHVGVLYLRLQKESGEAIIGVIEGVVDAHAEELSGKFTTASETSVRIR